MELKVNAKNDKYWEVEFVGEDRSIPNMIVESLHTNSDVEFAACMTDHPVVGSPKLIIRTKSKTVKNALDKAIADVEEQVKDFKSKVKKLKEGKGK